MRARVLVRTQFANCLGPLMVKLSNIKGKDKNFLMDAPSFPLASLKKKKEWIWLSRDFRNQLSKWLHSRNLSPAVFISPGLLSGSSPKHLNPAPPNMPHKSGALLIVLPHIKTGDMVNTLKRNLQRVKRIWGPLLILRRLRGNGPDGRGLRPVRTSLSK